MGTVEIILLLGVLVFTALVWYIVRLILRLEKTLVRVDRVFDSVHLLSLDASNKMDCIQPIFRAISAVGEGLEHKASAFKEEAVYNDLVMRHTENHVEKDAAQDLTDMALSGVRLWKKIKHKKGSK